MPQVFKESEYYQAPKQDTATPHFSSWEAHLFNGIEGLKADFGEVITASRQFPIKSTLTVIGFLTVLYIGFRISRSFVKITNRLRG